MNRFVQKLFRRMSENITGFWVVDQRAEEEEAKSYPDYPITPFGPTRLISKATISKLMKQK